MVLGPGVKCKLSKPNISLICLGVLKQFVHACLPFPAFKAGSTNNVYIKLTYSVSHRGKKFDLRANRSHVLFLLEQLQDMCSSLLQSVVAVNKYLPINAAGLLISILIYFRSGSVTNIELLLCSYFNLQTGGSGASQWLVSRMFSCFA